MAHEDVRQVHESGLADVSVSARLFLLFRLRSDCCYQPLHSSSRPKGKMSVKEFYRQLTNKFAVADDTGLNGLMPNKAFFVLIQELSHGPRTAPRFFSRCFMTFSAFSGLTPTSSRAARKYLRNRSKCASFRP